MNTPRIPRQRDIFDILDVKTIEERFIEFHHDNPRVYDELVRAARLYKRQTGRGKCGMSLLFGRVRWVLAMETDSADGFRLNNNYASFYSRLIMAQEPDLEGMFDTRRSIADGGAAA